MFAANPFSVCCRGRGRVGRGGVGRRGSEEGVGGGACSRFVAFCDNVYLDFALLPIADIAISIPGTHSPMHTHTDDTHTYMTHTHTHT